MRAHVAKRMFMLTRGRGPVQILRILGDVIRRKEHSAESPKIYVYVLINAGPPGRTQLAIVTTKFFCNIRMNNAFSAASVRVGEIQRN